MESSIFALELCLRFDPTLSTALTPILQKPGEERSPGELWTLFSQAARHMLFRKSTWVTGCWDFWDDTSKATSMYPDWTGSLLREEGARTAPSGTNEPYRGGADRYMTVTMACLMIRGSDSERTMARVCEIPASRLWHASSFERILQGVPSINFAIVSRATLYTIPRDEGWALTAEDMRHPKFQYLRPIL